MRRTICVSIVVFFVVCFLSAVATAQCQNIQAVSWQEYVPSAGGTYWATWRFTEPVGGYGCDPPILQTNYSSWITPNYASFSCSQNGQTTNCQETYTVQPNSTPTRPGSVYANFGSAGILNFPIIQYGPTETLTVGITGSGTVRSTDGYINCPGTCSVGYYLYSPPTNVTLNATPSSGWIFTGWSGACSGTGACTVPMSQNQSVTATFVPTHTLSVSIAGNGRVTSTDGYINCPGTCSHTYAQGTQVSLNATPGTGWTFGGWSGACSGVGSCNLTMNQNLSLIATFLQNETLTVTVTGSGNVTSTDGHISCPGLCSYTYPNGTYVTLNANPTTNWTLTAWGGACSGNAPSCTVVMTQNQSVTATFNQNHALVVTPSGSGSVYSSDGYINCPGTCSHTYAYGTQVILHSNPAQGWSLSAWGGACSGNAPTCTVPMTQDQTVTATFTQNSYTLTVSTFGSGTVTSNDGYINCPGTCSHTYLSLTNVTLTATPAQGWSFSGWTGQCTGVGSCTLTMLGNYSVTGVFVQPGHGSQFVPVTPCRLIDTRSGSPIQGGTYQNFNISTLGSCGIPTTATAYSLNLTILPTGPSVGYVTVWPTGKAQPITSTMNSQDGRVKADAVIVAADSTNSVSVYSTDTSNILLDVDGYFTTPGSQTYEFYPLTPCRVVDTRGTNGPLGGPRLVANTERDFPLRSSSCIPSGLNIAAYSLNVTAVPNPSGQQLGYLTVWPTGTTQPNTSTLNNNTATIVANAAIVAPGTSGQIAVYPNATTDLLIDINGYFAAPGTGGLSLYTAAQCRVIDTRQNQGQPWQGERTIPVTGSVCAEPSSAQAYIFNATALPSGILGYLTLWADGQAQPITSTLNAYDGYTTNNMAIVSTTDGSIDAYASGLTQLLLDITGYFAP